MSCNRTVLNSYIVAILRNAWCYLELVVAPLWQANVSPSAWTQHVCKPTPRATRSVADTAKITAVILSCWGLNQRYPDGVIGKEPKKNSLKPSCGSASSPPQKKHATIGTINVTVHHFPALNRNLVIGSRAIKFLAEVRGVQTSVNNLKPNLRWDVAGPVAVCNSNYDKELSTCNQKIEQDNVQRYIWQACN